jgi:hypothetical protein
VVEYAQQLFQLAFSAMLRWCLLTIVLETPFYAVLAASNPYCGVGFLQLCPKVVVLFLKPGNGDLLRIQGPLAVDVQQRQPVYISVAEPG